MPTTALKSLLLMGGGSYASTVLATSPLALWTLSETSGTVAADSSGNGYPGAYSAVTLNDATFAGSPAPSFNGTSSFVNVHSAGLAGAFNGAEGTIALWWRIPSAVWSDNAQRLHYNFYVNTSNLISLRKETSNTVRAFYVAGGTASTLNMTGTPTTWTHSVITWSASAGASGEARLYTNGVQDGATETSIGTWAGAPISTRTILGAFSTTATGWYSGNLAYAGLWGRALTPAEISGTLYRASFAV